jgi:uncharacterized membrane protein (UPF0127 family)
MIKLPKTIVGLVIAILIAGLVALGLFLTRPTPIEFCTLSFSNGVTLENIELASTSAQRRRGLSKRNLEEVGSGMLFVFPKANYLSFWMRDTQVPLSIGFFSKQSELFQITHMQPLSDQKHPARQPAMMALELPQGGFAQQQLVLGVHLLAYQCHSI